MEVRVQLLSEEPSTQPSTTSSVSSSQDDNVLSNSSLTIRTETASQALLSLNPFTTRLEPNDTVISLKRTIHERWSVHPKQMQLRYYGELLEDNQLIMTYEILRDGIVVVELESAVVSLVIACPTGQKVLVIDIDLNCKAERLRECATAGLENSKLKEHLRLFFQKKEINWKDQLRTIKGLEDRSELSTGIRLHVNIPQIGEVKYVVDLSWTVKTLKEQIKGLTAHQIAIGNLVFRERDLNLDMVLRNVPDLDDDETLKFMLTEVGGYLDCSD